MAPPLYQREWLWKGIERPFRQIFVPTVRLDPSQVIDRRTMRGTVARNLGQRHFSNTYRPLRFDFRDLRNA